MLSYVQFINHTINTIKPPLFTVAMLYMHGLIYLLLIYWAKDETNLKRNLYNIKVEGNKFYNVFVTYLYISLHNCLSLSCTTNE